MNGPNKKLVIGVRVGGRIKTKTIRKLERTTKSNKTTKINRTSNSDGLVNLTRRLIKWISNWNYHSNIPMRTRLLSSQLNKKISKVCRFSNHSPNKRKKRLTNKCSACHLQVKAIKVIRNKRDNLGKEDKKLSKAKISNTLHKLQQILH